MMLDEGTAVLLGDALRANPSLTAFSLTNAGLWRDAAAGAALVGSLSGHPSLRALYLSWNDVPVEGAAAAGAALAALLLANAPALQTLDIGRSRLGDEGMRPVVEALRHNTHLTKLACNQNNMSEAFARDVLLPAVRANTGLRKLVAADLGAREGAAREAETLVAARTAPS
jgi:Ran GTPase-activating protein (RanGAP) involved in mRNA processing and transport